MRIELAQIIEAFNEHPEWILPAVGPIFNRQPCLRTMRQDLPRHGSIGFEELAGLFASNSLNHAIISLTFRQAAYLFGTIRRCGFRAGVEIGRYKGGSAVLLAAAMEDGHLWSIDSGEKVMRIQGTSSDEQLKEMAARWGLNIAILTGDSRTIPIEMFPPVLDFVFIDGDHSYEGVSADIRRFATRLRVGGALFLDDARDEPYWPSHRATVGLAAEELVATGAYRWVKTVDRLAHLEKC